VRAFGVSDRGPVRRANEDAFLADEECGFYAVADGMGGRAAGEVASRLALDAAAAFICRSHATTEFSWPCGIDAQLSFLANRLKTAVYLANRRVFRAAESHDEYTGMGSTIAAVLVGDTAVAIAHVGDSRVYRWNDGTLECLTRDDSWAATVLQGPHGSPPADHPMRHVLTNVLGARDQTEIHVAELPRSTTRTLLLCSDGAHGALDHGELAALLARSASPESAARAILEAALQAGTRDNVTALVVCCDAGVRDDHGA
jgi:protein phosphatase